MWQFGSDWKLVVEIVHLGAKKCQKSTFSDIFGKIHKAWQGKTAKMTVFSRFLLIFAKTGQKWPKTGQLEAEGLQRC